MKLGRDVYLFRVPLGSRSLFLLYVSNKDRLLCELSCVFVVVIVLPRFRYLAPGSLFLPRLGELTGYVAHYQPAFNPDLCCSVWAASVTRALQPVFCLTTLTSDVGQTPGLTRRYILNNLKDTI